MFYVFAIINNASRKIEHIAVTSCFNASWVVQQLREATPFGKQPKYLLHDNDPIFISKHFQEGLTNMNIKSVRTAYRSPWQNGISERLICTLRRELLDHIIPLNEAHMRKHVQAYMVDYYNTHRTHQGIDGQTPVTTKPPPPTLSRDIKLISLPVLGGLYHTYEKAA